MSLRSKTSPVRLHGKCSHRGIRGASVVLWFSSQQYGLRIGPGAIRSMLRWNQATARVDFQDGRVLGNGRDLQERGRGCYRGHIGQRGGR